MAFIRSSVVVSALALVVAAGLTFPPAARAQSEQKPQSELAAKSSFKELEADDPSIEKALVAHDLEGARKLIGKSGAFQGEVVKVYTPDHNKIVILNFARNYKDALTAVIRPSSYARFPDLTKLKGKKVLVTGKFEEYRGAPQIVLTDADQLKVIK